MNSADRERVERRLAAILAADVAGYSRLMGEDEEGTHATLTALRREVSDPRIAEHRGRIVKTTGDGLLVEFLHPEELLAATKKVVEAGYKKIDTYSPFPVHGVAEANGAKTILPWLIFGGVAINAGIAAITRREKSGWTSSADRCSRSARESNWSRSARHSGQAARCRSRLACCSAVRQPSSSRFSSSRKVV